MLHKSVSEFNLLEAAAFRFHEMGLSVIPTRKKKALVKWKKHHRAPFGIEEIRKWFSNPANGVGVGISRMGRTVRRVVRPGDLEDSGASDAGRHA